MNGLEDVSRREKAKVVVGTVVFLGLGAGGLWYGHSNDIFSVLILSSTLLALVAHHLGRIRGMLEFEDKIDDVVEELEGESDDGAGTTNDT